MRCVCVCSRPAVSTISTSYCLARAISQASGDAGGVVALLALTISQPMRWLQIVNCSTAAREVSQAATIYFLAFVLATLGQLGNRRGFSRAVDACYHHDGRGPMPDTAGGLSSEARIFLNCSLDEHLDVAGDLLS